MKGGTLNSITRVWLENHGREEHVAEYVVWRREKLCVAWDHWRLWIK